MKGTIRILIGFLIVFGVAGTLDNDPSADLTVQYLISSIGVGFLLWGAKGMKNNP